MKCNYQKKINITLVLISLKHAKYFFWRLTSSVNILSVVCFTWHTLCHEAIPCITSVCLPNYIIFYFTFLYLTSVPYAFSTDTRLLWFNSCICCCSAYVISGFSFPCSWLTGIWKIYTQMCSRSQVTLKNNISENATNNRLYQIARIDASFISTSSALTGLIRPAVSETFFLLLYYMFYSCFKGYINNAKKILRNCGFGVLLPASNRIAVLICTFDTM